MSKLALFSQSIKDLSSSLEEIAKSMKEEESLSTLDNDTIIEKAKEIIDLQTCNENKNNEDDPYFCSDCGELNDDNDELKNNDIVSILKDRHNDDHRKCEICGIRGKKVHYLTFTNTNKSKKSKKEDSEPTSSKQEVNEDENQKELNEEDEFENYQNENDEYDIDFKDYEYYQNKKEDEDAGDIDDKQYYLDENYPDHTEDEAEYFCERNLHEFKEYMDMKEKNLPTPDFDNFVKELREDEKSYLYEVDDGQYSGEDTDDERDPDYSLNPFESFYKVQKSETQNPDWRDDPKFSPSNARKILLKQLTVSTLEEKNQRGSDFEREENVDDKIKSINKLTDLNEIEDIYHEKEEEYEKMENDYDAVKEEMCMETSVFEFFEIHRRVTQFIKDEDEEYDLYEDGRHLLYKNIKEDDETGYYNMKHKPTIEMVQNSKMEDLSKVTHNGTVIPQLFRWGFLICCDVNKILEDLDWEREHSKFDFMKATCPLLREINKQILVLNPDYKEVELQFRSLAEIRKEQASTDLIIPKSNMSNLIREIAQDFKNDLDFEPDAFEAIQTAAEAYLIELFQDSNKAAIHAERTHILPKDMRFVMSLRKGEFI
jgi:histone H3/H4